MFLVKSSMSLRGRGQACLNAHYLSAESFRHRSADNTSCDQTGQPSPVQRCRTVPNPCACRSSGHNTSSKSQLSGTVVLRHLFSRHVIWEHILLLMVRHGMNDTPTQRLSSSRAGCCLYHRTNRVCEHGCASLLVCTVMMTCRIQTAFETHRTS